MRKKRAKSNELPTIWRVPDDLWQKIQPLLEQYVPPLNRPDANALLPARPWMPSSSGCAVAANGTSCRASSPMIARSIGRSNGGFAWASSIISGPRCSTIALNWAG